jgi:cell division septation protein DedD
MGQKQITSAVTPSQLSLFAAQVEEQRKSIELAMDLLKERKDLLPLYVFGVPSYEKAMRYLKVFTKELQDACTVAVNGNPQTAASSKTRVKAEMRASASMEMEVEVEQPAKPTKPKKAPPKVPGLKTAAEMYDPAKAEADDQMIEEAKRDAKKESTRRKARFEPGSKTKKSG